MSLAVRAWLSLLLLAVFAYGLYSFQRNLRRAALAESSVAEATPLGATRQRPWSDFTFTERSGEPFCFKELEGKVWVANTFFASCPGFCLQMNREVATIAEELADRDVTFVSVTVDPVSDTPTVLREYAGNLKADVKQWLFVRGGEADTRDLLVGKLKLPATKEHSNRLVLVGPEGNVVAWYRSNEPNDVDRLKAKVRELAGPRAAAKLPAADQADAQRAAGNDAPPAPDKETP